MLKFGMLSFVCLYDNIVEIKTKKHRLKMQLFVHIQTRNKLRTKRNKKEYDEVNWTQGYHEHLYMRNIIFY